MTDTGWDQPVPYGHPIERTGGFGAGRVSDGPSEGGRLALHRAVGTSKARRRQRGEAGSWWRCSRGWRFVGVVWNACLRWHWPAPLRARLRHAWRAGRPPSREALASQGLVSWRPPSREALASQGLVSWRPPSREALASQGLVSWRPPSREALARQGLVSWRPPSREALASQGLVSWCPPSREALARQGLLGGLPAGLVRGVVVNVRQASTPTSR